MKKYKSHILFNISLILILFTAIALLVYSLDAIVGSQLRARQRIDEWNRMMASMYSQSSVSSDQISASSQVDDISDVSSDDTSQTQSQTSSAVVSNVSKYNRIIFGKLTFPSLSGKEVIVSEGTTKRDLRGAAGHDPNSAKPGRNGNCIIFGHRDSVFVGFADLVLGDLVDLQDTNGYIYTYRIISMEIVEPEDSSITRTYSKPMLTLVTCYPFVYIGNAPNRYVVICEFVGD